VCVCVCKEVRRDVEGGNREVKRVGEHPNDKKVKSKAVK
jgi:hypothetical protein